MRLIFLIKRDILRARTNQISDMRLCEGFVQNGVKVTMISPYYYRKDNIRRNDIFDYYGIDNPFKLVILPTFFTDNMNTFFINIILHITFLFITVIIFIFSPFSKDKIIVCSRNPSILNPLIFFKKILPVFNNKVKTLLWLHEVLKDKKNIYTYNNADKIIATNSRILNDLSQINGKTYTFESNFLNPVTDKQLKNNIDKIQAREKIGYSDSRPLIVYTGKLYIGQMEIQYLLDAAKILKTYNFLFTGGYPKVVNHYSEIAKSDNVIFTGFIHNYTDIYYYQRSADVLVSYYTPKENMTDYNFPQKICEYMMTGNPIVTPDYDATRDVLNACNAIFVEPDNIDSLVEGIKKSIEDKELVNRITSNARIDVEKYTFKKSSERVLRYINS